jgi:hypothetical protein
MGASDLTRISSSYRAVAAYPKAWMVEDASVLEEHSGEPESQRC